MADDTNAIMQPEDWNIDMSDAWQVLWWCRYLCLTKSQLESAIHAVGTTIMDIKRYLARQHSLTTDIPPAKSPAGAGHITSRNTWNRSPF
jgi:hypothetical protein